MQPIEAIEHLRFARFQNHTGYDDRALRRAAARGELLRLRRGAYVPKAAWDLLSADAQHRLEVAAAHALAGDHFTASHRSAAMLWQMRSIRRYDGLVHVSTTTAAGTRSENGYRRHAVKEPDLHRVAVHGVPCTSLERTVIDLALTEPFAEGVVAADWALREHCDADALARALDELDPVRGRRRAESVLEFANGLSGSPGESWSRVIIADAGLSAPELQVTFTDGDGFVGIVDFYWPEFGVVGEFDGLVKYQNPDMLRGRSASDVVIAEKRREDRLRACGPTVSRWTWDTLLTPGSLGAVLTRAGVGRADRPSPESGHFRTPRAGAQARIVRK